MNQNYIEGTGEINLILNNVKHQNKDLLIFKIQSKEYKKTVIMIQKPK